MDRNTEIVMELDPRTYWSCIGKPPNMMKWSRLEISNAVRELSRFMKTAMLAHMKAMKRVMNYVIATPEQGLLLKPNAGWDRNQEFKFEVSGQLGLDYAKDLMMHQSVSRYATFLNGAVVMTKSKMQQSVTLSVTEAELVAATSCAQDILFIMQVLESFGLKVKKL